MANSTETDPYRLKRDALASIRLNVQHYYWNSITGLLHPDIQLSSESPKIADVATGTGIWAVVIAQKYPNVQIDGFDISADQFPFEDDLPSNVKFYGDFDAFAPISDGLKGKYDVVHVRFLMSIVKDNDPSILVQGFLQMLKPGGYLQWGESHTRSMVISRPPSMPESETPGMEWLASLVRGGAEGDDKTDWVMNLAKILENYGFVETRQSVFPVTTSGFRKYWVENVFAAVSELSQSIQERGDVERARQVGELYNKAVTEKEKGVGFKWNGVIAIGRKGA